MAHNINLQFYMVASDNCQYVTIYEQAQWDTDNLPVEREDVGLALFWFLDDETKGCDLTNQGDNDNRAVWDIPLTKKGLYNFYMFAIKLWFDGDTVADDAITFYDGTFWKNISGGSLTTAPEEGEDWEEMTCDSFDDFYAFCQIAETDPFEGGYFNSVYNFDCEQTRIYKIGCNKYRVLPPEGITSDILAKVYDLGKTEVIGCYYIDVSEEETYVDIEFTEDNVYIVEIGVAAVDEEGEFTCEFDLTLARTYEEIVYAICTIEACWSSLIKDMLCKPVGTCCESCDSDALKMIEDKRYSLNMITNLWTNLMAYIEIEQGLYMGLYSIYEQNGEYTEPTRMLYLKQIEDMIAYIKDIVTVCGDCSEDDITSSNCQTC